MQVNNIATASPVVVGARAGQPEPVRQAQPQGDEATFESVERLKLALDQHPEVRAEQVAIGEELLSSVAYPPQELIDGISVLLAKKMLERSSE